jgi:hypothetical protein
MAMIDFSPLGFGRFKISALSSSIVLPPKVDDLSTRVPHISKTVIHFGSSGFRSFQLFHTLFLSECFHLNSTICGCMSPSYRQLWIYWALWDLGFSTPAHSLSLRVFSPKVKYLWTHVSLRSTTMNCFSFSGFRSFNPYALTFWSFSPEFADLLTRTS